MALSPLVTRILAGALALGAATTALAQDSGPLIDLLVRKGIVSDQEAEELRAELLRDFAMNSSAGKLDLGSRVQRFTLSGDVRVRYQYDNEIANNGTALPSTGPNNDRSRYRYRVRLAATALLANNWTLGTRLETANGATSTNDDFGGSGSINFNKDGNTFNVGQVFIQYNDTDFLGFDRVDFRAGKHAHPFFTPGVNGFWIDSDINPEGFSEELVLNDVGVAGSVLALRGGQYLLAANSRTTDRRGGFLNDPAAMFVGQAEWSKTAIFENNPYGWRIAPTLVVFTGPEVTGSALNNETIYDNLFTFLLPVEYTVRVADRPLALYGTYGYNFEGAARANRLYSTSGTSITYGASGNPASYDQLFNAGVRFGALRNPGDWQLTAEYRYVEPGAYTALLLDSDFNAGRTNGAGVILSGTYNLTDAVFGTVTWFHADNIDANSPGSVGFHQADVVQVDLSARF